MKILRVTGVLLIVYGLVSILMILVGTANTLFNNINLAYITVVLGDTLVVASMLRAKKKSTE